MYEGGMYPASLEGKIVRTFHRVTKKTTMISTDNHVLLGGSGGRPGTPVNHARPKQGKMKINRFKRAVTSFRPVAEVETKKGNGQKEEPNQRLEKKSVTMPKETGKTYKVTIRS